MKRGLETSVMAELLGVHFYTIQGDMRHLRAKSLRLGLRLGDWVEVVYANVTPKLGRIAQIRLSNREVVVDLNPLSDTPNEQFFSISDVRRLNEMEALARASQ